MAFLVVLLLLLTGVGPVTSAEPLQGRALSITVQIPDGGLAPMPPGGR